MHIYIYIWTQGIHVTSHAPPPFRRLRGRHPAPRPWRCFGIVFTTRHRASGQIIAVKEMLLEGRNDEAEHPVQHVCTHASRRYVSTGMIAVIRRARSYLFVCMCSCAWVYHECRNCVLRAFVVAFLLVYMCVCLFVDVSVHESARTCMHIHMHACYACYAWMLCMPSRRHALVSRLHRAQRRSSCLVRLFSESVSQIRYLYWWCASHSQSAEAT